MAGEAILPPEIIADILIRFDVKSLLALKCVCKLWCSIIKSRHFTRMHSRRMEMTKTRSMPIKSLSEDGDRNKFKVTCIRNGLVLEIHQNTKKFRIRNLATKTTFDLPDDQLHKPIFTSFVYLPSSADYKVINIFGKNRFGGCQVLTLGFDLLWRSLEIPNLNCLKEWQLDTRLSMCRDNVAYIMWFSDASRARTARDIVCIDMETEGFDTVTAPEALFARWENVWPMKWEDEFSLSRRVGEELHVWVLEDYRNRKWADSRIIISLSFLSIKYAEIYPRKFNPHSLSKGWLYFYGWHHGIWYNIESNEDQIIDLDEVKYSVKFSLSNPNASISGDF